MPGRSTGRTYDRIAAHFSATREHPWPEVTSFLERRPEGEGDRVTVGLDVGCGNGRHTEPLAERVDLALGVDLSRELLEEARRRGIEREFDAGSAFLHGDAAALPVADRAVDVGVYVAALHHLSPRERRIHSLNELARVLREDGIALVSAWSTTHDRFDREEGFDTAVDWTLPDGETVPRFYHVYDPDEFVADVEESTLRLASFEVSSGNCYGVVRRD
ncbi:MAG: class I SAM-dependent methyltransferase [Haloferacaceae archaeon]